MQVTEVINNLQFIIAKLELKQLEVIDRLSQRHNDYVIRCITTPDGYFLSVNGDWENISGFNEEFCIGKHITDFIPDYDVKKATDTSRIIIEDYGFDGFTCNLTTLKGHDISVDWKTKHFPQINAIVTIGRVKK